MRAPVLDLDGYVPFFLTAAANKMSRSASRAYLRQFGIGINEWRLLANLRISPSTTANDICQQSGLDKAAVSRALTRLEALGYVQSASDSADNRRRSLVLTTSGVALHDDVICVALAREGRLLDGFDDTERALLIQFLKRLYANADALDGEVSD